MTHHKKMSPLRKKIDLPFLKKLLGELLKNANLLGHIVDKDHRAIVVFPDQRHDVCKLIRGTGIGDKKCDENGLALIKKVLKSGVPESSICHGGFKNIALPLTITGQQVFLLVGQYVKPKRRGPDHYWELADELGIEAQELVAASKKLANCLGHKSGDKGLLPSKDIVKYLFERTMFTHILDEIAQAVDLEDMLKIIAKRARDFIGADSSAISVEHRERSFKSVYISDGKPFVREWTDSEAQIGFDVINSYDHEKLFNPLKGNNIRSSISSPLFLGKQKKRLGMICVYNSYKHNFDQSLKNLLNTFCSNVSHFISSELSNHNLIDGFARIINSISDPLSGDNIPEGILDIALKLVQTDMGWLCKVDGKKGTLTGIAERGISKENKEKLGFGEQIVIKIGTGVAGTVAKSGKSINLDDVRKPYVKKKYGYIKLISETRSQLAAPLTDKNDNVVGVISVESPHVNYFTDKDQNVLEEIAKRVVLAFNYSETARKESIQSKQLNAVYAIAKQLSVESDVDKMLQLFVKQMPVSDVVNCSVFLRSKEEPDVITLRASLKPPEGNINYKKDENYLTSWVFKKGKPLNIENIYDKNEIHGKTGGGFQWVGEKWRYSEARNQGTPCNARLMVPFFVGKLCEGVITVARKNPFIEIDQTIIEGIAKEISIIFNNARLIEELNKQDKQKSILINILAHELNTPLATLILNSQLLLEKTPLTDQQKQFANFIYQDGLRYSRMVKKLLSHCHIENESIESIRKDMCLNETVGNCIKVMEFPAKEKKLNIQFKPVSEELMVSADKDLISEVIIIFLDNAIKFTPANGEDIVIETEKKENYCILRVKDKGIGISPKAQSRVFEKFYQGDQDQHPGKVAGSGLGLAISKYIINAHEGEIFVESNPGEGSDFGFKIMIN